MPNPAADFRAFEARMGLSRVADTAALLGVSRQTVSELRNGRSGISPPMRRLMAVLEWCKAQGSMPPITATPPA